MERQPWIPTDTTKDCSQGECSIYCPEWCYYFFPPPPAKESVVTLSPLIIAVIVFLSIILILVLYFYLASICYANRNGSRRSVQGDISEDYEGYQWRINMAGLDEAAINSITVLIYKKDDEFVQETDCSVCLSEFNENERIRVLPECKHAFHRPCIDQWLKHHSSCPLCRVTIIPSSPPLLLTLSPDTEPERSLDDEQIVTEEVAQTDEEDHMPKISISTVNEEIQPIRRSLSMGSSHSISYGFGSSSIHPEGENPKINYNSKILHKINHSPSMKRSFSCGRFRFATKGRGSPTSVLPI